MNLPRRSAALLTFAATLLCWLPGQAQTLTLTNGIHTYATLTGTTVTMTGRTELRINAGSNPIPGSLIHLNSPDAWLFFPNIQPSAVAANYLTQIRVNGANAVSDGNIRVVQYEMGTVIIPHAPGYQALQVFSGNHFSGNSMQLAQYTYYGNQNLGSMNDNISSFRLKRGYMATFAQNTNGTGTSQVFVAQDSDLEVSVMPEGLDDTVSFVRVFPWRWSTKKGWAGGKEPLVSPQWHYDWDNATTSSPDIEYVPMRHNAGWNAYANINTKQRSTHALGFNEPDRPDQANMTVEAALAQWPDLLTSGLRLGSPAPSDAAAGLTWLYDFMDQAKALNYRVDYVAVHFYKGGWTAAQYYNWLLDIHQQTGKPVWITEFNNGANWTCCEPTLESQATVISQFIDMLDNAPFVERYAIYNWVGATRELVTGGTLNPAGVVYRDNASPLAYTQPPPDGMRGFAEFRFNTNTLDSSGFGNNAVAFGIPAYSEGHSGEAIVLDGADDFVQLSGSLGDSMEFTFAAWVYWNGGASWQRIFDLGNSTTQTMFLTAKAGDGAQGLRFTIRNGGTSQSMETSALTPGQWVHVAVTLKGNAGKLFVNGSPVASNNSLTVKPAHLNTTRNYLGKSQSPDPLFNGRLDDVLFLETALSDAQIAQLPVDQPPQFNSKLITRGAASPGQSYLGTIDGEASDPDAGNTLTYSKAHGPAWLTVTRGGILNGIPATEDRGTNSFIVRVTDPSGLSDYATLTIVVNSLTNLLARYAFDGNVNASAGPAHGLTGGGPVYTAGQFGQAIAFDGVDDFVTLPAEVADLDAMTIAMWVYWNGGDQWQRIFDFGNGTGQYLFLTPRSGGNTIRFVIRNGTEQSVQTGGQLAIGQWVHLAVTLAGNTARLYVNGTLSASAAGFSARPSDFKPLFNYLGKSQFSADPLFNGRMDELRIFDSALTAAQINALRTNQPPQFIVNPITRPSAASSRLYTASIAGTATNAAPPTLPAYAKVNGPGWLRISSDGSLEGTPGLANSGPNVFTVRATDAALGSSDATLNITVPGAADRVAHYEFESNVLDSATARHGTATGSPVYAAGLNGRALRLDGTDDYVTILASAANLNDITVATWVYWEGGSQWQRIFDFGNTTTRYMFLSPRSGSDTLRFAITTNGFSNEQVLETTALPTGQWTHLAVSIAGGVGRLYVNGSVVSAGPLTLKPSAINPVNNFIGKSQFADPLFKGRLDGFRIFNRALTETEVASLANPILDNDGDGHSDTAETGADGDNDGIPNHLDTDGDGDGMPDSAETFADTNGNGVPNFWDIDSDNDGLPDGWEFNHGLNAVDAADANGDLDGDGLTNAGEFVAGTAPNAPGDSFLLVQEIDQPFSMTVSGKAGRTYQLLRAGSVTAETWNVVATVGPIESSQLVTLTDPSPSDETTFYRAAVTAP